MDIIIVAAVVAVALGYIGWKAWVMVRPGPKAAGCHCSGGKGGCSGCPMTKL